MTSIDRRAALVAALAPLAGALMDRPARAAPATPGHARPRYDHGARLVDPT